MNDLGITTIVEEWPYEYIIIRKMRGNSNLKYQRADDWSLVFIDPEGIEWLTHEYDSLLGPTTIECSPEWIDDNFDPRPELHNGTNEFGPETDMDAFAKLIAIPTIELFYFEHHIYISKNDPLAEAKIKGYSKQLAPEWAWDRRLQ